MRRIAKTISSNECCVVNILFGKFWGVLALDGNHNSNFPSMSWIRAQSHDYVVTNANQPAQTEHAHGSVDRTESTDTEGGSYGFDR